MPTDNFTICLRPVIIYTGVKKEKNDISKNVKQVRQQSCGGLSHITIFKRRSHYGESKIGIWIRLKRKVSV